MGSDAKKQKAADQSELVGNLRTLVNTKAFQPGPLDSQFASNYSDAVSQGKQDYSDIMGQYTGLGKELASRPPTTFGYQSVSAPHPAELDEAYGDLRQAMPVYQDFAKTGGYSDQDITDLRARGVSPIRAAYGNTMMEMNRTRALGGNAGSPNYIAAASKAQRELPEQLADATQGVNAQLAENIRQGKLAGAAGMTSTGSAIGGLSSQDASRILQAAMANQGADLQAQGMTESAYENSIAQRLGVMNARSSLYGTAPGMASMFGNQVLQNQAQNNQLGLGLIDTYSQALNGYAPQGTPWWKIALQAAATAAPYVAMAASDKNIKKQIKPIDEDKVRRGIKKLNLSTWKYKGDETTHMGPMAQDVKKYLGVGDGKTIHLADIMAVMLATAKDGARA